MKLLLLLLSTLVVAATVVVAVPVDAVDGIYNLAQGADVPSDVDNLVEDFSDKTPFLDEKPTVDVTDLINDLRQLHESASDVIQRVEATLSTLESLMPHSIRKRQTTIDGSVYGGPGGTTGRIDVNHKNGGTTYNGNISRGPGGTSYGGGLSHQSGNSNFGANVNKGPGGTSYGASYGKTWNNGRTSVGANVGRSPWGGTSGGITFTHKF